MKACTLLLVILIQFIPISAQDSLKTLSIEQAILGTQNELKVENIDGLSWMGDGQYYCWIDSTDGDAALVWQRPDAQKPAGHFLFGDFKMAAKKAGVSVKRFPGMTWQDTHAFRFWKGSTLCVCNVQDTTVTVVNEIPEGAGDRHVDEITMRVAYTLDNNLWIAMDREHRIQVTFDGTDGITNGSGYVHRSEFGINEGIFWSPDGKAVAFYRKDERHVTTYPLVDIDTTPATLRNTRYPMAGQASERVSVGVYDITTGSLTFLETGQPFDHYLTSVCWTPRGDEILIAHLNRNQDYLRMLRYDAFTGKPMATLFEERDDQWVEPSTGPLFINGSETRFLWLSKRDGFNNIYQYDLSGKLIRQITQHKFDIIKLDGFDTDAKKIFYHAASADGLHRHGYYISIRGGKAQRITSAPGQHRVQFRSDGEYVVDRYNNLQSPNKIVINDAKGNEKRVLLDAPNNLLEFDLGEVKLLEIMADNGTPLMARMILPPNLDESKKYPAIIYVYGGPHGAMVQDSWISSWRLWFQFMAQRGYIVFTLDNRGTNNRGADFEQIIHRQLGTVEVADQMAGVEYLRSLDYVDDQRLGVHGWSYGGFLTLSMLTREPGVFNAGVAGGPVTDWKYYEIMYGERYMDTPQDNPAGYKTASPLTYIKNLDAKCLIIHGCVDPVVAWQNSLMYLRKAIDNQKHLDYFVYPGDEHNMRGQDRVHLYTMISEYFFEHL
ncbi:DPP IV N-terminal domain-containing protein [bacterium]|nr:DPP IV N-terminal domain-containing protein [bacterium]